MTSSPSLRPRVVLDTDTFNEVDDQFALAHLLLSPEQVDLEAVYAAPFHNTRSTGPADGMEKSYEEIQLVLALVGRRPSGGVHRGSPAFLPSASTPVDSPAARDLIARALAPSDRPLVVCAIGAITNVASALLLEPAIASRITVVWLGGHAPYWPHNHEFNLQQDPAAARVVFEMAGSLVQIPCMPVASHLVTTVAELERHLEPYSKLGRYLTEIVRNYQGNPPGWSKVIWDISASAYVIGSAHFPVVEIPSPILQDDLTWKHDATRRHIRVVQQLDRDVILTDFFNKARNSAI
jgi:inosine-uridine nucleoside N-ribohydrolase